MNTYFKNCLPSSNSLVDSSAKVKTRKEELKFFSVCQQADNSLSNAVHRQQKDKYFRLGYVCTLLANPTVNYYTFYHYKYHG